ncbi:MAG: hypothetical protein NVS2B7_14670 [Herpetosiphon sp.]
MLTNLAANLAHDPRHWPRADQSMWNFWSLLAMQRFVEATPVTRGCSVTGIPKAIAVPNSTLLPNQ